MTDKKRTEVAVQEWLDSVTAVTSVADLTLDQADDLLSLIGHPGMKLLLGLMIGIRQGYYLQLGNAQLGTPEGVYHASAIQGVIKGIDLLPQELLRLAVPDEAPSQEQK
jgi:hypothetical protein